MDPKENSGALLEEDLAFIYDLEDEDKEAEECSGSDLESESCKDSSSG